MTQHYDDGPDIMATNKRIHEIEEEKLKLEKEKHTLIEKEKIKNQKAYDLSEQLKKLKETRDKNQQDIIKTQIELNKLCTHEKIRTENRSYSGGYLDRAEYWTDYYCVICGVKLDEKVKYGGFG